MPAAATDATLPPQRRSPRAERLVKNRVPRKLSPSERKRVLASETIAAKDLARLLGLTHPRSVFRWHAAAATPCGRTSVYETSTGSPRLPTGEQRGPGLPLVFTTRTALEFAAFWGLLA